MTKYRLGDCLKFISNGFVVSQVRGKKESCGGFPFTRIETLSNDQFNRDKMGFADIYDIDIVKDFVLDDNDILMSHINSRKFLGRTVLYKKRTNETIIHGMNLLRIKTDGDKLEPVFASYYFKTPFFRKCIDSIRKDAINQSSLSITDLVELRVWLPSLCLQRKIAAVLSSLDDKIALNKKMNQKLEAMAKRLYDYWFVQFDFPDKNGRPYKTIGGPMTYNETLKREIPAGWEVRTLAEYLDCNKYSLTAKSYYDFIQYLDTSSLTENTLESLQRYESIAESPSRAKRIVHANDILYSTVRPQQKHYGIIKNPAQNMIASTGFAILSCKYGSEYNDMFYLFLIQEKNLIKLSAIADSNASSYPSFNPSDLLNLSICLPNDLKIIEPLVKRFSSLFSIIERNQKENQKLTALRDKLLPLLMNGQVVVG